MKKIVLFFAIIMLAGMTANAQTEAGKIMFNGDTKFNFSSSSATSKLDGNKSKETITANIGFNASGGLFIIDNLAVGGILELNSTVIEVDDNESDPVTNTTFGLFGRYYLLDGNFKPFGQLMLGYGAISGGDEDVLKFGGFMYGLGLGGTYFINENIGINIGLEYVGGTLTNKEEDKLEMELANITFGVGVIVTL